MTSVCGLLFEVTQPLFPFLPRSMVSVRMSGVIIPLIFLDFFMQQLTEVVPWLQSSASSVGNELAVFLREAHLQHKTVRSAESDCGYC